MGKQAYVRLVEHGKQQNPFLHICAASGKSAAKSLPLPGCVQQYPPCAVKSLQTTSLNSNLESRIGYYYTGQRWKSSYILYFL